MTEIELKKKVEQLSDGIPKTEEVKEEPTPLSEVTKKFEELKAANDRYEAEQARAEEIRARQIVGGRALAGSQEKTPEEIAREEAAEKLKLFGY